MRCLRIALPAILLLASACLAGSVGGEISLFGGLTIPVQPEVFKDSWNTGSVIGGWGAVRLSERLSLVVEVAYGRYAADQKVLLAYLCPSGMVCLVEGSSAVAESRLERCAAEENNALAEQGTLATAMQLTGGTFTILTITGGVNTYILPSSHPVAPYVAFRAGYAQERIDNIIVLVPGRGKAGFHGASTNGVQMYVGPGINFNTGPYMDLFVEGRYGIGFHTGDETGHLLAIAGLKIKM